MTTRKTPPKTSARRKADAGPSAEAKKLITKGRKYYTQNYKPRELILDHGKGSRLYDTDGKEYIDFGAGIAVCALGHANPKLNKVLAAQSQKLWHTSNVYFSEPAILLMEELCKSSRFAKRAFMCSSGGEANEAAIKVARKYAANKGKPPEQRKIITFTGSFHGRTLATVTATAQPKYHEGFEPLPAGFVYVPFNNKKAFDEAMGDDVCGVLTEVVQGEGGIRPIADGMLQHIQAKCHEHDALLMLDQVQDGMGRTGHLFSHFAEKGIKPDTVSLAKGLGGGFPIGAMLVGEKAQHVLQLGSHGSTFGGNPMACAVAREILKELKSPALQKNMRLRHKQIIEGLESINATYDVFTEIRGRGLMIGAELRVLLRGKAADICTEARAKRLLTLQAGPNVVRFLPPLNITHTEVKSGLKRFEYAIQSFLMLEKNKNK